MTDLVLVASYEALELKAYPTAALAGVVRDLREKGCVLLWDSPAPLPPVIERSHIPVFRQIEAAVEAVSRRRVARLRPFEPDPPCALFRDFWR